MQLMNKGIDKVKNVLAVSECPSPGLCSRTGVCHFGCSYLKACSDSDDALFPGDIAAGDDNDVVDVNS